MSEAKHTPGPWGIEQTPEHNWIGPMRRNGEKVDQIVCHTERKGLKDSIVARNDANAALIASAPDLLKENDQLKARLDAIKSRNVLNAIVTYCEKCGHSITEDGCAFCFTRERDQLKAELAQARAHNAALLEACDQLPNLLCDVGQLLDGWHNDGTCWSAWDESVRKRVSEAQTKIEEGNKLRAAIALEKGEK